MRRRTAIPRTYEDGVAFYLDGPPSPRFSGEHTINRAVHFAGGRLNARLDGLGSRYSVELWFWNGLPTDARPVTGTLVARGASDQLAIGGTRSAPGRLVFLGEGSPLVGKTPIAPKTWNHVVLVRDGRRVAVYLNGAPDLSGEAGDRSRPRRRDAVDRRGRRPRRDLRGEDRRGRRLRPRPDRGRGRRALPGGGPLAGPLSSDIVSLLPVLVALGGSQAVAEIARAIQEVGRWWP